MQIKTIKGIVATVAIVLAVAVSAPKANAYSYSSSPGLTISDNSTVSDDINVVDSFNISDLTVWLNIDHTWVGDLFITLTGPDTTAVTLMDRPGRLDSGFGNSDNLAGTYTFDDAAGQGIPETTGGSGTVAAGTYFLDFTVGDSLSLFDSTNAFGVWTLAIKDNAGGDQGTLHSWGLDIVGAGPAEVPEPATMLLFGTGLAGLIGSKFKRKKK